MSARACPGMAVPGREVDPSSQHHLRRKRSATATSPFKSLYETCCNVIVSNLERYSPDSFVACYEDDWDHLLRLRHRKTKPQTGCGGLDGTGRMAPAISDKLMTQIEKDNPHLAESEVADELVWRDCVEYRFRRGGLTRPKALNWPWPNLLELVNETVSILKQHEASSIVERLQTVETLLDLPMSVSLLQATGAGKIVRKALKAHKKTKCDPDEQQIQQQQQQQHELLGHKLEALLDSWKTLATDDAPQTQTSVLSQTGNAKKPPDEDVQEALALAQDCSNWRQLFAVLKEREDNRRSSQGKRMREIRKNLASGRPKIVKVRPATAKQQRVSASSRERVGMMSQSSSSNNNTKLSKIRREAAALSSHRHFVKNYPAGSLPSSSSMATSNKRKPSSFGDAVAFVSGVKKQKTTLSSRKKTTIQRMGGGKVMNVPVGRSAGIARKPPPSISGLPDKLRKT